ncbi:MAG: 23S rRNA (adenine(2503)-C(2))-methyltransferase RlmN [Candidatus Omnitrophica bacterium]|nr:23S rRNA (adenine(2503)-C(2))-methyltransferase RlmN [Candidatus Omnitrophota bacterium]
MSSTTDILSLSKDTLIARLAVLGEKSYRATQILDSIFKKYATSYNDITTLSKELREQLSSTVPFPILKETDRRTSKDGTIKFLFTLSDGEMIETVFIPTEKRATLCISSQAGCKFGCAFCASGLLGWKRNLTVGEILGQVLYAQHETKGAVSHIVFMGTGEPFDNYDNVLAAAKMLNAPEGFHIAARHITISTCGVVPGIERFAGEGMQIELSVSLHASNDTIRSQLMPVNKKYPLKVLISACRAYAQKTNRQVTLEYILIRDLTCTPMAAKELARLMKGWLSKVNLIPYNVVKELPYLTPSREDIAGFKMMLERSGVICTLRAPRGTDIAAACGQLRHSLRK